MFEQVKGNKKTKMIKLRSHLHKTQVERWCYICSFSWHYETRWIHFESVLPMEILEKDREKIVRWIPMCSNWKCLKKFSHVAGSRLFSIDSLLFILLCNSAYVYNVYPFHFVFNIPKLSWIQSQTGIPVRPQNGSRW